MGVARGGEGRWGAVRGGKGWEGGAKEKNLLRWCHVIGLTAVEGDWGRARDRRRAGFNGGRIPAHQAPIKRPGAIDPLIERLYPIRRSKNATRGQQESNGLIGVNRVTRGYKGLQGVIRGYKGAIPKGALSDSVKKKTPDSSLLPGIGGRQWPVAPSEDDSANRAAISRWMEISKSDGKVAELRDQVRPGGGGRMLDPDGLIGARQRNNVVVVVAAAAVVVVFPSANLIDSRDVPGCSAPHAGILCEVTRQLVICRTGSCSCFQQRQKNNAGRSRSPLPKYQHAAVYLLFFF